MKIRGLVCSKLNQKNFKVNLPTTKNLKYCILAALLYASRSWGFVNKAATIPNGKRTVSGAYKIHNGENSYLKEYSISFFCVFPQHIFPIFSQWHYWYMAWKLKIVNAPSESIPPHCVLHTGHMYICMCSLVVRKKLCIPLIKRNWHFMGMINVMQ